MKKNGINESREEKGSAIMKESRKIIFDKYNGRCSFCGDPLLEEKWQACSVERIGIMVNEEGLLKANNNTIENKIPSCLGCNRRRIECSKDLNGRTPTADEFKKYLYRNFWFLRKNPYYENAILYGLIQETGIELKFYFEIMDKCSAKNE